MNVFPLENSEKPHFSYFTTYQWVNTEYLMYLIHSPVQNMPFYTAKSMVSGHKSNALTDKKQ